MNAAARLVHRNVLTRHLVLTYFLTRQQMTVMVLSLAVVVSALSVIYVSYMTRVLQANYQHQMVENDRLQIQRSQLLLERGTWMMQGRIQQIAENKLDMVVPDQKSVKIISAR
jgi:cell division protein FtsL